MSTTARLGIDIVGRDLTRGAFSSVQRGMAAITRSMTQFKFVLAGFLGGNLLKNFVRSIIDINKASAPVKAAFDHLSQSWEDFALKVGGSGLNAALLSFAERMGRMIEGTDGLAASIGGFLGGAVNVMASVFEGIGRAIAFTYDNMAALGRLLAGIAIAAFAQQIIGVAAAMIRFGIVVRETGLVLAAFRAISNASLMTFLFLAAGVAYATDSVDKMKSGIDTIWETAKRIFPQLTDAGKKLGEGLGFNFKSLSDDLETTSNWLDKMPKVIPPATEELGKLGKAAGGAAIPVKGLSAAFRDLPDSVKQTAEAMKEMARTFTDAFSDGFVSLVNGSKNAAEAFRDMAKSILDSFARMAANKLFSSLFGGIFGGTTGLGGLFSGFGFGGLYAKGGTLGAGKWGIAGEAGPEIVRGPAIIEPMARRSGGGGGNVFHINIVTPAPESFRKSQGQIRQQLAQAVAAGQRYR